MDKVALVIEDDEHLRELLSLEVEDLGYEIETAVDGSEGLEKAEEGDYSFIILDLNLPGIEGVEVCKRIREKDKEVPLIVLTARADDLSKVLLIELGADDYITKPFNPMELKARIKAVLRRSNNSQSSQLQAVTQGQFEYKGLVIDHDRRKVSVKGKVVDLTKREYDILCLLAETPGRPLSREQLTTAAYGYQASGYETSVTSHITRLRAKIEPNPEKPMYVLTSRGIGYVFSDA